MYYAYSIQYITITLYMLTSLCIFHSQAIVCDISFAVVCSAAVNFVEIYYVLKIVLAFCVLFVFDKFTKSTIYEKIREKKQTKQKSI